MTHLRYICLSRMPICPLSALPFNITYYIAYNDIRHITQNIRENVELQLMRVTMKIVESIKYMSKHINQNKVGNKILRFKFIKSYDTPKCIPQVVHTYLQTHTLHIYVGTLNNVFIYTYIYLKQKGFKCTWLGGWMDGCLTLYEEFCFHTQQIALIKSVYYHMYIL